jgi:hypothetical protein
MQRKCAILNNHLWPLWLHFSVFSHKRHGFDFLNNFYLWYFSHSKKNSAKYCHKCKNIFMQVLMRLEFSQQFFQKLKYQISSKSVQWKPSCFHADGRTDRHDDAITSLFTLLRKRLRTTTALSCDFMQLQIPQTLWKPTLQIYLSN